MDGEFADVEVPPRSEELFDVDEAQDVALLGALDPLMKPLKKC